MLIVPVLGENKKTMLRNYLIDIVRFIRMHRLFSLLRVLSLITGIIAFFLFWLYRIAPPGKTGHFGDWLQRVSLMDFALALAIFGTMSFACSFMQKTHMKVRARDILMRKIYGESDMGIMALLVMETTVTILTAMVLGLVILDQIIPYLNAWTNMQVSIRVAVNHHLVVDYAVFSAGLVLTCGIIPAMRYSRFKPVDILHKIDLIKAHHCPTPQ